MARCCKVMRGKVMLGKAVVVWCSIVWRVGLWSGMAWVGVAWLWQSGLGGVRRVWEQFGVARQLWLGTVSYGQGGELRTGC